MANDKVIENALHICSQMDYQNILGPPRTKEDLMEEIDCSPALTMIFNSLQPPFLENFIAYCTGAKGLPLTYDSVFKFIFNSESHPERLSRFLSLVIGKEVIVKRALPNEGGRIIEEGSLLIMDVVVEFEGGALGNVEIQKVPYTFPGERSTCYSSDLVLRQYSRVKKEKSSKFSYKDMKPIYTIVILEKSDIKFHNLPDCFLHRSKQVFDTGLKLELLQEYFFIPLDIFKNITQTIDTELEAWLYCLCSEEPVIIYQIIQRFPWFRVIYDEMTEYRSHIGEVLSMFSEALKIMDRNTVQLMIDEQMEQLEQLAEQNGELAEQNGELAEQNGELAEQNGELAEQNGELAEQNSQLAERNSQLAEQLEQLKLQKAAFEIKAVEIFEKEKRIKELEEQLDLHKIK